MPRRLAVAAVLPCMNPVYIASMVRSTDMAGSTAMCLALGVVFNEPGEGIPIRNRYIGGGLLPDFFGAAIILLKRKAGAFQMVTLRLSAFYSLP